MPHGGESTWRGQGTDPRIWSPRAVVLGDGYGRTETGCAIRLAHSAAPRATVDNGVLGYELGMPNGWAAAIREPIGMRDAFPLARLDATRSDVCGSAESGSGPASESLPIGAAPVHAERTGVAGTVRNWLTPLSQNQERHTSV